MRNVKDAPPCLLFQFPLHLRRARFPGYKRNGDREIGPFNDEDETQSEGKEGTPPWVAHLGEGRKG